MKQLLIQPLLYVMQVFVQVNNSYRLLKLGLQEFLNASIVIIVADNAMSQQQIVHLAQWIKIGN